ncbi:MAG: Hsp20/alpha crystallin family protein [Sphaerochaetaceae bacterium]|nr:Hsp20/alpha crystallin family protein [Sphaerochaetaceae bacterium]
MYNSDFNSFFDDLFASFNGASSARIPAVDVIEDTTGYSIDVELPGYTKDDVDLKFENNSITIQTNEAFHKANEAAAQDSEYLLKETHLKQEFKRVLSLPKDIDEKNIKAQYSNGVLGIRIPKLANAMPRTIEIAEQ